ncbi:adenylate/guanylate cyclase domain-containing protein [Variovorax sp. J22R133]|uniref:ATP-binding protein n=1 Tax=Variovorax brevis TaxID=3053503 RepID=UPI002576FA0E|nr:adenylate/guanylate cyclase domain-containing protein [Variovorax sp. J22R133]MDM0117993.1 adenylate/guanylate cyclase domain-containing protein [Variovorax sp. J22R133]
MNDSALRHRLMAILCADASGYSRRMAQDEFATVAELDAARQVFRERVAEHGGRIVDTAGDSVLAVFETAAGAVDAAVAVQRQLACADTGQPEAAHLRFRIGVHLGDVIEKPDGSVYGHGVNVAARLQALALEGGISVSDSVRTTLGDRAAHSFVDQGQHAVRNIGQPLHAFGISTDWEAAPQAPRSATPSTQALGNLSTRLPPLYGRAEDVAALVRLLELHRVVSVVGPGGIGKTRAAQAVAHAVRGSHADGAWIVELAPLAEAQLVVPTVARVLGHPMAVKETALASLVQVLRDQRLLLVLDNCEHLLEAVAELAAQIVAGAPGVRLLVTSQEPLHIAQEQISRLNALAVPPSADARAALGYGAVQLFVARAQAVDAGFAVDAGNVDDVVEICRRLDGMALAIELAAARVSLLGVRGVRQRLYERLKLLGTGSRTALPRHQTLRAALQWSHGLLTAVEQTVFDRLGVFMGTFSLEAAQQVAADEAIDTWAVLDHLASLVDKSLVLVEGGQTKRYRLLESSRAFALERLAAAGSLEAIRRRHAQAIADTLTGDDPFEEPLARMRRIAPDLDNVRAAAAWAMGPGGARQIAVALAAATDMLWDAQGFNDEGARLYRAIVPWVDEATPPRLAARFWFAVSNLRMQTGTKRQAEAGLKAAELFRSLGDRFWVFMSLTSATYHLAFLADRAAAKRALTEMDALLDPAWPSWLQFAVAWCKAICEYSVERRPEEARKLVDSVLQSHLRGDSYYGDGCELLLPHFDLEAGDFASALHRCDDLLGGSTALECTYVRAYLLAWRSLALVGLGDLEAAGISLRTATTMITHTAGPAVWLFCYIAQLLARQGRLVEAAKTIVYIDNRLGPNHERLTTLTERCHEDALAIIKTGLDTEALGRLRDEGSRLSAKEVIAMAFPVGA